MKYESLFSPIKIRGMELRNRVMISGMATNMSKDRKVTQQLIDYHVARAKGGIGLTMVEATAVHQPSAPPIYLSLGEDQYVEGMKELTDAVHEAGGKVCVQLYQGGLATVPVDPTVEVIIPSEQEKFGNVYPGITKEKIDEVVDAYGQAARRAAEAGFDCVELHAAHGYSVHSFLSGGLNARTDEYGGSFENRCRFPLEVIDSIRANIPEDMPLLMRVVPFDDGVPNGLTAEEVIDFCKMAKERGVDIIDVTRGNAFTALQLECPANYTPRGFNVPNAARLKKETGLVTAAVGRINDPKQADDIISSGQADLVVMGKAHIADPEFCNKAMNGEEDAIIRCTGCSQGCNDIACAMKPDPITCLLNPATSREREFEVVVTETPKKVLVAGGGIAGISAAIMLRERGHEVVIAEKSERLGGNYRLAGETPSNEEYKEAIDNRIAYAKRIGVEMSTGTECNSELIDKISPDYVLVATGSVSKTPDVPVSAGAKVYNVTDLLSDESLAAEVSKGTVVVIGGGLVGMSTAEFIKERGGAVTMIDPHSDVIYDVGVIKRITFMLERRAGINLMPSTECVEICDDKVIVETGGERQEVACDAVVLTNNFASSCTDAIQAACVEKGIPFDVVGDAKQVGNAMKAVREAADAVLAFAAKN